MREWTAAAALMCAGRPVGTIEANAAGAAGRHRRGVRSGRVAAHGHVRVRSDAVRAATAWTGSGSRRAGRTRWPTLPPFAADELNPAISDGDLVVQACADDPQVAFHAIRNLARIGRGVVVIALVPAGLQPHVEHRPDDAHAPQPDGLQGRDEQPRHGDDADAMTKHVWVSDGDAAVDARRQLHGHAAHPHADRVLGSHEHLRAGGHDRPRRSRPGHRSADTTSSNPSRSMRADLTAPW